jgi:nitrile hydratase
MDGVHDMGGMHGFGPIPIEHHEPVFHELWEARVVAMTGFIVGNSTIDHFRHTIEQMPPAVYLSSRYYERWLWAIERMAREQGLLDGKEAPAPEPKPNGEPSAAPRFADGERVRVANVVTSAHTRVPRYVRNRVGTIMRRSCAWSHPTQSAATGRHGAMEHIYTVSFPAADLFGAGADHTVTVDVWERDLEEAK